MTYLQPLLTAIVAALALGIWAGRRRPEAGRGTIGAAALALFLVSWPPFVPLLAMPLEYRYKRAAADAAGFEAIVVLSSNVVAPTKQLPVWFADRDTYERCVCAAWLYRNHGNPPVLASGGGSRPGDPYPAAMTRVLIAEGVRPESIWTEGKSRSTYENAVYSAQILRRRGIARIALVTEGYHMLRAEGCFRRLGFDVRPRPCNFRTMDWQLEDWLPSARAVFQNERTLHELVGLLWYKAKGWI